MLRGILAALLIATLMAFGAVGCGNGDGGGAITPEKCIAEGFNPTREEIVRTVAEKKGGADAVKKEACTCALAKPGASGDMGALGGALSSCLSEMAAESLGM